MGQRLATNSFGASCVIWVPMGSVGERVAAARDQDLAAFEDLVHEFTPSVYRIAVAIVGDDLASDVAQETFFAAWRGIAGLRDPDRFGPWLHRIAVNRARSVLRSRRAVREVQVRSMDVVSSGDFTAAVEARSLVRPALTVLSADHRVLVALHYAGGLSISEVAAVLSIPEGTVKSRLNAALARLRVLILEASP